MQAGVGQLHLRSTPTACPGASSHLARRPVLRWKPKVSFITHGHGDHWFAAGLLAERFGARVVASAGTIAQMHGSVAARPLLWDKLYAGLIPPSTVTAVTVPANRLTLEGPTW